MSDIFIVSAVRTPIGSFGGMLKSFTATELGSFAIKGSLLKANINPQIIDDVIMGHVMQANVGQAPARQAAKFAGLSDTVNCSTINKVCASGMKAVTMGVQSILLKDAGIVIVGGMESMSNVPFYADKMRWGNKYGNVQLLDGLVKDGLTDVYDGNAMGIAAEKCAADCAITREEQDTFAIESYKRSQVAVSSGKFDAEIIPIEVPQWKGQSILFSIDEEPFNVTFEKIPTLKSAFVKDGSVTAANSSTMNDGAAAIILADLENVQEHNLTPLAKIIGYADAEQSPEWFTTSPSLAIPKALEKAGITADQVDYWEINEAFAVVAIENGRRMQIKNAQLNIHGGAVSLGHPLGCSGARIIVTLVHILKQNNARYGVAAICNGGGGASAIVIENLNSSNSI